MIDRLGNHVPHLYLITDRNALGGRDLCDAVAAAIAGGVDVVQLREKNLPDDELLALAVRLHRVTRSHGVPLIINDRVDIMAAAGAEGVHLGARDAPIQTVRQHFPGCIIGATAKTPEQVAAAGHDGADYLGIGPAFPSTTKPNAGPVLGPEGIRTLAALSPLPSLAIGGITADNAAQLAASGVAGICIARAILAAPDIRQAARMIRKHLGQGRP